jgi:hypothetical protein
MLNNISNFFNIIKDKRIKKELENSDLIAIGTKQSIALGDYKPTAISYEDLKNQLTGIKQDIKILNTDLNVIFVSPNGDDLNEGSINAPVKTLEKGKILANEGDLVYVLPGTYTFDNRLSNGTPFNGNANKVNLWKNKVSYYFSQGSKVVIYNNTNQTGLSLFRPLGDVANEKCFVRGYLDLELEQFGVSAGNGESYFFTAIPVGNDLGYYFDAEINNVTATREIFFINRNTANVANAIINIKFNRVEVEYKNQGSAGSGSALSFREENSSAGNVKTTILGNYVSYKHPSSLITCAVLYRNIKTNSDLNIYLREMEMFSTNGGFLYYAVITQSKNIVIHTEKGYYNGPIVRCESGSGETTITGNYYPKLTVSGTIYAFYNSVSGSDVINFTGNLTLVNTNVALGIIEAASQVLNINANVNYINGSTSVGNFPVLRTNTGTINFTGIIKGALPLTLLYPRGGKINLYNAYIFNNQAVTNYRIMYNDTSVNSKVFANNSKIEILQNSGASELIFGNRIFLHLQNSYFVTNASQTFYNSTQTVANAKLYLVNSTLSSAGESIITTGEVIAANANVRVLTTLPLNLNGTINIQPNLPLE